ncbi:CCA tRNA nucleotidyltransferase [Paenibacillus sanguinis]|uniref:CCA tRNA nucleotidyltransferase n=1 Tax=Paenibacillus sanguinis TaxID=225906 RepID=UPI00035EFEA9|nr:CCA tRNA nucleotidyltransferase [Paenibacillus sanguinis]
MNRWNQVDPLMLYQGENVLRTLLNGGHQAFFVGGCVRDELMGQPVHDLDIATSAKPDEIIGLFERTVPTGIQHGTITVLMGKHAYEVTTFRKESEYADHRHPLSVEFVDAITEDLRRRDFTMNAIARELDGTLTDPFDGQSDIQRRILRCVGVAEERFDEDALRMMRAVRFASTFGFRPVKSLWAALLAGRGKLSYIATERVRVELEKIVLGPDPLRGLALLQRSGLLQYAKAAQLPVKEGADAESNLREPVDDKLTILVRRLLHRSPSRPEWLKMLPLLPTAPAGLRWSLLLQGLEISGEEVSGLLKNWTFPNQIADETAAIVRFDEAWGATRAELLEEQDLRRKWIHLQIEFGREIANWWLQRQAILLQGSVYGEMVQQRETERMSLAMKWHQEVSIHKLPELAVSGRDVLAISSRPGGPWLGELMKRLLLHVALGELPNERRPILEFVESVVREDGDKRSD